MGYWSHGYYYRSRVDYCGGGELAEILATIDLDYNSERRGIRVADQQMAQADRLADQAVRQTAARVDALVRVGLEALGYHRHARGPWRRRRGVVIAISTMPGIEESRGNLAEMAAANFLRVFASNSQLQANIDRKMSALRKELVDGSSSTAVHLAAEAAVLAWIDFYCATISQTSTQDRPTGVPPRLDRRVTWTQGRYLKALVTVERIRHLSRPRAPLVAVQIVHQEPQALAVAGAASEHPLTAWTAIPHASTLTSDLSSP